MLSNTNKHSYQVVASIAQQIHSATVEQCQLITAETSHQESINHIILEARVKTELLRDGFGCP